MIDTLAANYPEAKIDFLVRKRVAELVYNYPNINKVHTIEKETVREIRMICKKNKYDLAIAVSPRFSIALGLFLGRVKSRLGTRNRWYSFLFNIWHVQHRKYSTKHEMEYNLDMLDELNCDRLSGLRPVLNVEGEYIDKARETAASNGIDLKNGNIIIHMPTLGSAKVWSDSNFVKLIDLLTELNTNIILTGVNSDKPRLNKILGNIKDSGKVFVVVGLQLNELAALIKLSNLLISNSTGPIHIAAAVGTFVVGLYSPVKTESPVRWGPVAGKKKIFVPEKDDNTRDVMDDIKPEDVFAFVKDFLSGK